MQNDVSYPNLGWLVFLYAVFQTAIMDLLASVIKVLLLFFLRLQFELTGKGLLNYDEGKAGAREQKAVDS